MIALNRFKVFIFNSLLLATSSLILQVIRLTFHIYVSNKISPEALGIFQLIMVTYYFGITLASSGVNISCIRVISEEFALNNDNGIKKASKKCIQISLLISLLASLIFYFSSDNIVKCCLGNKVSHNVIYLICIALPLISMSSALNGYFLAVRRVYKNVIGGFLEQISKIVAIILLFNNYCDFSLESICFSLILADVISEIISFVYLIIVYIFDIRYHFSTFCATRLERYVFRILRILFPVAITSYIKSGLSSFKQLIIPSSLQKYGKSPSESLSEYGIITGMAMPIVMFPSSFIIAVASLLIPEFSRYYIKNDYKKIRLYTDKLLVGTFLFSLVITLFFCIFGNYLGQLIYHSLEAGIYIKIFSLLIPFMYVDIIIDNILKGLDAQSDVMIINIIDLIVSTTFIFLFVPILGIKGFIISIFISEILNLCLSLNKLLSF